MSPLPLRCHSILLTFVCAVPFGVLAGDPTGSSAKTLYDQALLAQSNGAYGDALSLFLSVQSLAGNDPAIHHHIAQCVESLRTQRDFQFHLSAMERARGMLTLRASAAKDLSRRLGSEGDISDDGYSFAGSSTLFMQDQQVWEALAALISTVPGGWVTIESESGSDASRASRQVAERLVREGMVPFERVSLWNKSRMGDNLNVVVSFRKRESGGQQTVDPGVLIQVETPLWVLDETPEQQFHLFVLNPGAYRRWTLEISNEEGNLIHRVEGAPKVLAQVRWNGQRTGGQRVSFGRCRARLTLEEWRSNLISDETSFIVSDRIVSPDKPVPAASPPPPLQRQHRFFIRFKERGGTPLDRDREILSRVAYLLAINPNQRVVAIGSVDGSEPRPEELASLRTQCVLESLMELGIPRNRLVVRENPARDGAGVALTFEDDLP